MKIALFFNFPPSSMGTTGQYLTKIIEESGISFQHFWTKDAHLAARDFDFYLRIDHGDYKDDLPSDMHPSAFYAIDTHLKKPYKKMLRQIHHYDVIFCAQHSGMEQFRKNSKVDVQWIPLGCDPNVHKKMDLPKQYSIGFVGRNAMKFDRGRHLRILKDRFPNSFIGEAPFQDIGKIYSSSKIGFNSSIAHDVNMRIFEIMACGCFLLTNKIKNKGFEEMFKDGEHLVTYTNDRDLFKKVEYYLTHDEERKRIAKAGYELVINHYTYFHAIQRMFNYIAFKFSGKFNKLRI